jgi:hypothetical protein
MLSQPDLALPAHAPTSIAPQMTSLFPHDPLLPMHFSPPNAATPLNITPMDILASSNPLDRLQNRDFQPDLVDHLFRPQQQPSPPSAAVSTPATSPPHVASPNALHDMSPGYAPNTSSLSSALDGAGMAAAPLSDAASSPVPLAGSGSELAFASMSSGPPTSTPGSSAYLPSPASMVGPTDNGMDQDPHLLAVGGFLKKYARLLNSQNSPALTHFLSYQALNTRPSRPRKHARPDRATWPRSALLS